MDHLPDPVEPDPHVLWAQVDPPLARPLGHLLRVVPNLLYYGGLIAVMAHFAPVAEDVD